MNIVVTGASSGIGRETARILAGMPGNRLVIIARNSMKIQALAGECNIRMRETVMQPVQFDLSKDDPAGLADIINRRLGRVDVLINNAGTLVNKPFGNYIPADLEELFKVNAIAPFMLIQAMLPFFNPQAHIVNIGSMGGVQGSVKFAGLAAYSASKGALAVLTECLADELAGRKISVNCLAFGSVQTEMLARAFPDYKAPVSADEMGSWVADFALNGHRFFNGKVLPVSLSTP